MFTAVICQTYCSCNEKNIHVSIIWQIVQKICSDSYFVSVFGEKNWEWILIAMGNIGL